MKISIKSTHESVPLKHSVVTLYYIAAKYSIGGVNMGGVSGWGYVKGISASVEHRCVCLGGGGPWDNAQVTTLHSRGWGVTLIKVKPG